MSQDEIVDRLLNRRENDFYVEAGGYDGVNLSNTLFFDEGRQWLDLLVETNPNLFTKLKSSDQKVFISNTCLSPNSSSIKINFTFVDYLSRLDETEHRGQITGHAVIQCFPIQTYFLALNILVISIIFLWISKERKFQFFN